MTVQMTDRSARAHESSLGHHTSMSSSDMVQRTPTKSSKRSKQVCSAQSCTVATPGYDVPGPAPSPS